MQPHWTVQPDCLEIAAVPFYWRLSSDVEAVPGIAQRMPARLKCNEEFDYLELELAREEQACLDLAYRQNANIGFINPESGQINTYGSSVNNFFLAVARAAQPRKIFEIGCGAGFSIMFMREHGWDVAGIDPSEYSQRWSEQLGFKLINEFFDADTLNAEADLIYCNDVFEHVSAVLAFSREVFRALKPGGTFCFATTNSTQSIAQGDISMLEHQHVNMFTERSIRLILAAAGFADIKVDRGSYGNTFHVSGRKVSTASGADIPAPTCPGYFERAGNCIESFGRLYTDLGGQCNCYVPLRCLPYLATVGDFGRNEIFDSNVSWRGKYIDGYARPIGSLDDVLTEGAPHFFVGSLTFFEAIKTSLTAKGILPAHIHRAGTAGH
jgi:SAM-dependent methyltransferase